MCCNLALLFSAVIQEQQQYIRDNLGADFYYLFCGRKKGGANAK